MRKLYTSPKAEIVNYSTPDVVQVATSNVTFDLKNDTGINSVTFNNLNS